jgi:hypothetical protein
MSPLLLAAVAVPLYFLTSALSATPGDSLALMAIRYSLGLLLLYGYPCWLITRPANKLRSGEKQAAIGCALVAALMFVHDPGQLSQAPLGWTYVLTPLALAIVLYPFISATRALRAMEAGTGQSGSFATVAAFIWLFCGPIGLYFLHKRFLATHPSQGTAPASP